MIKILMNATAGEHICAMARRAAADNYTHILHNAQLYRVTLELNKDVELATRLSDTIEALQQHRACTLILDE